MTQNIRLWHTCNLSSNPVNSQYPGGFDRRTLNLGCLSWVFVAQRALDACPNLHGILIDDPFGKWTLAPDSPPQTLLDQRSRAVEHGTIMNNMVSYEKIGDAVRMIRDMGLEVRFKIGYPLPNTSVNDFIKEIIHFSALNCVTYIDGNALREWEHTWMSSYARHWKMPALGIEAMAEPGSILDSEDYPALFTAEAWNRFSTPRRNPGMIIWRGSNQVSDGTASEVVQTCRTNGFDLAMFFDPSFNDQQARDDIMAVLAAIDSDGGTEDGGIS